MVPCVRCLGASITCGQRALRRHGPKARTNRPAQGRNASRASDKFVFSACHASASISGCVLGALLRRRLAPSSCATFGTLPTPLDWNALRRTRATVGLMPDDKRRRGRAACRTRGRPAARHDWLRPVDSQQGRRRPAKAKEPIHLGDVMSEGCRRSTARASRLAAPPKRPA